MGSPTLRDNALTTLDALKPVLGLSAEDDSGDGVLIQLINQASASIERALGRKLRRDTYTERLTGTGNQQLLVQHYPIVKVRHIRQAGELISPGLYDYKQHGSAGVIYRDDGWAYHGYPHGLAGDPIAGKRNIEVRYTAGYILPGDATARQPCDLPADLEGLCQEMVQYIYGKLQTGGTAGMKAFAIADVRWEWSEDTPATWQDIINEYKRVWI